MTKEEIIKSLESVKKECGRHLDESFAWICEPIDGAIELIKALEQQPTSEDCVSRQAVIAIASDSCLDLDNYEDTKEFCDEIKDLPPVTPTRKVGKWINKSHKSGCGILFVASECTCCRKKTLFNCDELLYNYCPNCGADMRGAENG